MNPFPTADPESKFYLNDKLEFRTIMGTPLSKKHPESFREFVGDLDGFRPEADAYVYVIKMKRMEDDSTWYYVGQATEGKKSALESLKSRIEACLRDDPNKQKTVQKKGTYIYRRGFRETHRALGIVRLESLSIPEKLERKTNQNGFIDEVERRVAYEIAIEKDTTNILGGK